jgi:hypothetical protein
MDKEENFEDMPKHLQEEVKKIVIARIKEMPDKYKLSLG